MTFEKTSLFEPHGVKHAFKMIKSIDIETCFFRFSRENGEAHGETRMTFPQIQSLLEYLGGGKEVPMPEHSGAPLQVSVNDEGLIGHQVCGMGKGLVMMKYVTSQLSTLYVQLYPA